MRLVSTRPHGPPPYVMGVSWPRSGHHLLVRLLRLYYGPDFAYCAFYNQGPGCCGQAPCARPGRVRFSKNHDFDGTLKLRRRQPCIVQIRAFPPSVVSNFELYLRQGGRDDAASFARFASAEFTRYRAFRDKWVRAPAARGLTVIDYADLVARPAAELSRALAVFGTDRPDPDRLARAVAHVDGEAVAQRRVMPRPRAGVHAPRDVTQFRHYDAKLFGYLDKLTLTRQEVTEAFRRHLGRDAAEGNMLALQTTASVAALHEMILGSPEYAARARRRAV